MPADKNLTVIPSNTSQEGLKTSKPLTSRKNETSRRTLAGRHIKNVLRSIASRALQVRYKIPFSPYVHVSDSVRNRFSDVMQVWKPADAREVVYLRWLISEWCNYKCPYCDQTHDRWHDKGGGFSAHAFDNFSVDTWIAAFKRHFADARLSVVITGGESLLDHKSMVPLLSCLTTLPGIEAIRIDTNAWWNPELYNSAGIDKSKIVLMCTFHPSQTGRDRFFERIRSILAAGFRIGMINYVMDYANKEAYEETARYAAALGVPLHPNPLWDSEGLYSPRDLALLQDNLPPQDYLYRTQQSSPKGTYCLFPSISYEMDYRGAIEVGCHGRVRGSFFDRSLPQRFAGPVPCPAQKCLCLDKYSFLETVNRNKSANPLALYSEVLKARMHIESPSA